MKNNKSEDKQLDLYTAAFSFPVNFLLAFCHYWSIVIEQEE